MISKSVDITAIIIAKNAENTISRAIKSLHWAKEIIVIDNQSTDNTGKIARKSKATLITSKSTNFSQIRTLGLKKAKFNWIFYLDADEVVSNKLQTEIRQITTKNTPGVFKVRRENYFLGKKMNPDYVDRLFHKTMISGWKGKVHESPILKAEAINLDESVDHYTHIDISSMLAKTNNWTNIEAELLLRANHPPVYWWRLVRMIITKSFEQFASKNLLTFGREGVFEGYFQVINSLVTYTKLWEKQHSKQGQPS